MLAYCFGPDMRPKDRLCGASAARAAGYRNNADRRAYELLREPDVIAAIEEVLADLRKQHAAVARQAFEELHAAALANITDILKIGPNGISLRKEIPAAAWAAVQEIHDHPEHGLRVKMAPKAPLLALLLKATGFLAADKTGATVNLGVQLNVGSGGLTEEMVERARELVGIRTATLADDGDP